MASSDDELHSQQAITQSEAGVAVPCPERVSVSTLSVIVQCQPRLLHGDCRMDDSDRCIQLMLLLGCRGAVQSADRRHLQETEYFLELLEAWRETSPF